MEALPPWALITCNRAGWATMRKRWETDLHGEPNAVLHMEDFAPGLGRLTHRYGFRSLWHLASGRKAAREALRLECRLMLFCTIHYAAWVPRVKDVRYLFYGDSTPDQLCRLYDGHPLKAPFRMLHQRIRALANDGHYFLCMSHWFAQGLIDEFGVPPGHTVFLPPYVDCSLWQPQPKFSKNGGLRAVFLGADWNRKGGDLVLEVARRPEYQTWQWEFVSPAAPANLPNNCKAHRNMRPETQELRDLIASCDLLVLPTKADCSSLAALEAGAAGLPAVMTAVGGVPDLIKSGETGTLMPQPTLEALIDALEPYRLNPAIAGTQGMAARRFIETEFNREKHLEIIRSTLRWASLEMPLGSAKQSGNT